MIPISPPLSARRRLAILIGVSLLVHALIFGGLPGWIWTPRSESDKSLKVVLARVKIEEKPAPKTVAEPPAPEPRSAASRVEPVPATKSRPKPSPINPTRESSTNAPPDPNIGTAQIELIESPPPAEPARPGEPPRPAEAAPASQLIPPGAATLNYKVIGTEMRKDPPTIYYGQGTIEWKADSADSPDSADGADGADSANRQQYHLDLRARLNIMFVSLTLLSSHSEGEIDRSGLQPRRYTETPRNKSTLAINFNRDERKSITFSATTNSLPLLPGVQDRLSVLLQLGALVRASPERAGTSGAIELAVAGPRGEVEPWRFAVLGTETVETGAGVFQALHLKRSRRQNAGPASYEQSMDIWIATGPEVQAYPVKIRFTEPNSNRYDLTLDSIE